MKALFSWFLAKFRRTPPVPPHPRAPDLLIFLGIQYYVVARFAAMAKLMPVSGNQYHHAVEMFVKSQLAKTISLEVLRQKYRHGLKRTWKAFKKLFPTENLSPFDKLIGELDRFEWIRYPDHILEEGMRAGLGWNASRAPTKIGVPAAKVPHYEFAVTDLDQLVDTLFRLCSINATWYMSDLNEHAVSVLENDNPACKGWFPARANVASSGGP